MLKKFLEGIRAWIVGFAIGQLVKLSVTKIQELPWTQWGMQLNQQSDAKFEKRYADQVQAALAQGLRNLAKGLET